LETRIGSELAGYRIESVIGRGGMGVVYLAEHVRLKRKVALKVLAPELADDELFRDRFIHESELAASLDHPNIIDIYDAGEADGLLYLAMRYVGGSDLKTLIGAEGALGPERAVALITQVAGALDAAHEGGLVHRDVKPANVLVQPPTPSLGEHAYLTDFGLTKRPESMSGLTKTGQFLGSVEYAAPEQFEGRPLGPWTDLYALGCVLYECLTGRVPFPRELEAAVMHAHIKEPPPKPSATRSDVPAGFDQVVASAMAKEPANRYASGAALSEASAHALVGEAIAPTGTRPRRKLLAWVAGAVAVALIAGVAFAVFRPKSSPPPPGTPASVTLGVVRIDPATNRITDVVAIPSATDFAVGDGFLWVDAASSLDKVDQRSKQTVGHIPIRHGLEGVGFTLQSKDVVFANGRVWDVGAGPGEINITTPGVLFEVDPKTNRTVRQLSVPTPNHVAFAEGTLWVASAAGGRVFKVDPDSGRVLTATSVESTQRSANPIAAGPQGVWLVETLPGQVTHIAPVTGRVVATLDIPHADGVALSGGFAWITNSTDGVLTQVNVGTDAVLKTYKVAAPSTSKCAIPGGIAATDTDVWVLTSEAMLVRLNQASGRIVARIPIGRCPYAVAVDQAGVWVSRTDLVRIG
jgi:tRNA A-37 threonylcarbamoyl transferase component Bud32